MNNGPEDDIYRTDEEEKGGKFSFPITCIMIIGIIAFFVAVIYFFTR